MSYEPPQNSEEIDFSNFFYNHMPKICQLPPQNGMRVTKSDSLQNSEEIHFLMIFGNHTLTLLFFGVYDYKKKIICEVSQKKFFPIGKSRRSEMEKIRCLRPPV